MEDENNLSNVELDIIKYLENESHGALLIDGPWGVGKTHTINKIVSTKTYELKKIKYYSNLDIDKFDNNLFLKDYILDNKKEINSENYVTNYIEGKLNIKMTEKKRDIKIWFFSIFKNAIRSIFRLKDLPEINEDFNTGVSVLKSINNKYIKLNRNYLLIIDEIERKKDTLSLKEIFLKLIDLQEREQIKIILIINSKELKKIDKYILKKWKEKIIFKEINFNSDNVIHKLESLKKLKEIEPIINYLDILNCSNYKILDNLRILKNASNFINNLSLNSIERDSYLKKDFNTGFLFLKPNKLNEIEMEDKKSLILERILFIYLIIKNNLKLKKEDYKSYKNIYKIVKKINLNENNEKKMLHFLEFCFNVDFDIHTCEYLFVKSWLKKEKSLNKGYLILEDKFFPNNFDENLNLYIENIKKIELDKDFIFRNYKFNHFNELNLIKNDLEAFSKMCKIHLNYIENNNIKNQIVILNAILETRNLLNYIKRKLALLRDDIFTRKILKDIGFEYGCFINSLMETYYMKRYGFYSNNIILRYKINNCLLKNTLIKDIIYFKKSRMNLNIYQNDLEKLILRSLKIDNNFILKLNKILKNEENIEFKETINNVIKNIEKNLKDNIIEFIDYEDFYFEEENKYKDFFKEEDILKDLEYMNNWINYSNNLK